jgi:hypothetical protein
MKSDANFVENRRRERRQLVTRIFDPQNIDYEVRALNKVALEKSYLALGTLLKSGPILSRIGFNVRHELGFNDLNKYERETPVHQDAVRKFFKDTDFSSLRSWFNIDLQQWFSRMGCFDDEGVFILDQSHLVVPRNKHYGEAVLKIKRN